VSHGAAALQLQRSSFMDGQGLVRVEGTEQIWICAQRAWRDAGKARSSFAMHRGAGLQPCRIARRGLRKTDADNFGCPARVFEKVVV
jgi:hypothetical protein